MWHEGGIEVGACTSGAHINEREMRLQVAAKEQGASTQPHEPPQNAIGNEHPQHNKLQAASCCT
jgi:hypothetical protein